MKIIYYINGNPRPAEDKKHIIKFFGILGCIKVNALGKATPIKQEGKFNVVEYYFDYPYFSKAVNPERFQKELKDGEKRFTRVIISLWLCSFILSTTSAVLSYLAHSNQKSKKVIAGLITTSVVLSIIASVFFVAGLLWIFFDFVKEKLVVHRMRSLLKDEVSLEWIKLFKNQLMGEKSETTEQTKDKDIEDIIQFLLERKKILALFKFLTNGEKLVQAGMAMVNDLLLKNVHPNNIILDTNSLGGGIATEVLKRFEDQGIYLTLINSNSYSSLKDVANTFKKPFHVKCLNILHKFFGLELNSEEVIKETKCPILIAGRKDDTVITEEAQIVGKLEDSVIPGRTFRINAILKHDPKTKEDCNITNIHTDHEEHLIWKNGEECKSYIKVKSDFIELAHDYLTSYKINEKFYLEKYRESDFSKNFTGVELTRIKACSSVQCVG